MADTKRMAQRLDALHYNACYGTSVDDVRWLVEQLRTARELLVKTNTLLGQPLTVIGDQRPVLICYVSAFLEGE